MTMGIIFIYEWGHIGTPDGCATPSARLDPYRGVRRPPSRPTSPFLRPPKCRPSRSNSALIQITAWFRISRFWVTEVARKPVVREGRIPFECGSVGRRPTSRGQAFRGWIGPRPSSVSQCGWPWPVINSRGLLPFRSARRLRMKRRWFKKNGNKPK